MVYINLTWTRLISILQINICRYLDRNAMWLGLLDRCDEKAKSQNRPTWWYIHWHSHADYCNVIFQGILIVTWMKDDFLYLPSDSFIGVQNVVLRQKDVKLWEETWINSIKAMSSSDQVSVSDKTCSTEYICP